MYGIHAFRIINIDGKILHFVGSIDGESWEWRSRPQGSININIVFRITVVMEAWVISGHDIGSRYRKGAGFVRPVLCNIDRKEVVVILDSGRTVECRLLRLPAFRFISRTRDQAERRAEFTAAQLGLVEYTPNDVLISQNLEVEKPH